MMEENRQKKKETRTIQHICLFFESPCVQFFISVVFGNSCPFEQGISNSSQKEKKGNFELSLQGALTASKQGLSTKLHYCLQTYFLPASTVK